MRCFVPLTCLGLVLLLSSLGCGNGSPDASGGSGGVGATGGTGGTGGGMGGGGGGGQLRLCNSPNDCVDFGRDPCIISMCIERICNFDSLPDYAVCVAETGVTVCLEGACQPIWESCDDEGAQDGDFCEPTENIPRLGRCESGSCVVNPCEIAFDCWDGDRCTSDICESGECRHENAPDGTECGLVSSRQCFEGVCGGGAGGQGGGSGQGG